MLYYNPLIYNEHEKSNLNTYNCHMRNGMQQSRGAGWPADAMKLFDEEMKK